ncbi:MAG: hypothetical protein ACM3U1_04805 [Chloroflexota bacterium]
MMKIKKFVAKSLKEGKDKILEELGEEAVILSSRTGKKPDTGEDFVEIVAAIDDKPLQKSVQQARPAPAPFSAEPKPRENEMGDVRRELAEIKSILKYKFTETLNPVFSQVYKAMIDAEFSEDFARETLGKLAAYKLNADFSASMNFCKRAALEKIKFTENFLSTESLGVVALFGPTGSGKTTSLIKLAIISGLIAKRNVAIISTDTHKVGGAEQLQTLSSIAGIPFSVAYSAQEATEALRRIARGTIAFVDTSGISFASEKFSALKELSDELVTAHKILTLPGTFSFHAADLALGKYGAFGINSVAITKLDECDNLAGALSAIRKRDLPVSFLANGAVIPDDIEPAGYDKLSEYVFRDRGAAYA